MLEQYKITLMMIGAGIIGLSMFALYSHGKSLEIINEKLKNERDQYKTALEFQNAQILSQKADYEAKLKELPTEIEKIKTRYVTIYQQIDSIKEDGNATSFFNSVNNFHF
ncbi:MAG TPA: hypothetical protein VFM18_22155 [Methanosarcina sp.]|nr:hypothetical protein [Methanosarcina sp.]